MAPHQLVRQAVADVRHVKAARLGSDLGMQEDLQEEVAQLVGQVVGVPGVDGLDHLIGLFEGEAAQGAVGLGPVPGAAARRPQAADQVDHPGEPVGVLPVRRAGRRPLKPFRHDKPPGRGLDTGTA